LLEAFRTKTGPIKPFVIVVEIVERDSKYHRCLNHP
jgi:hypothetical protein